MQHVATTVDARVQHVVTTTVDASVYIYIYIFFFYVLNFCHFCVALELNYTA